MKFDEKWAEGGRRRTLPHTQTWMYEIHLGKLNYVEQQTLTFQQIYRTHKWLYVFTSELGLMAGGGYIAFYEGKESVIFTSLKWKSSYFFSCPVSSGVNRLGNSTWCLTKPPSPSCTWSEIRENLGIQEPKRLAKTIIPTTVWWVPT